MFSIELTYEEVTTLLDEFHFIFDGWLPFEVLDYYEEPETNIDYSLL